jgi:hypothetical protein
VQALIGVPSLRACWNTGVRMPWKYVMYHTIDRRDSVISIDMGEKAMEVCYVSYYCQMR